MRHRWVLDRDSPQVLPRVPRLEWRCDRCGCVLRFDCGQAVQGPRAFRKVSSEGLNQNSFGYHDLELAGACDDEVVRSAMEM